MRVEAGAHGRRRQISLTSLIDVIFLLLLFFMLTATFSRFGDVELTVGGGASALPADRTPAFVRVAGEGLSLNAEPVSADQLGERLAALRESARADLVIVSVRDDATSQQLVDAIAAVNASGDLPLQIVR